MIKIKISKKTEDNIKDIWSKWFFKESTINELIEILNSDVNYRKIIFNDDNSFELWKEEFLNEKKILENVKWKEPIIQYIFDDLSDVEKVKKKYYKDIKKETEEFLKKKYECYRKSNTMIEIINKLDIVVCPYCNRNFIESYTKKNTLGQRRLYFKGDLDHYYSKSEFTALILSFFNLVPSCKVCNHEKLDTLNNTFYPFYDNQEEYIFSIEELTDNDIYDITFEKAIDDIKNKRYDSTVMQGISDNFKIKIRGIDGNELNQKMKNSNEIFNLEKKYNNSKEYVMELIRKKYIYPDTYKESMFKNFGSVFKDEKEFTNTFFSYVGNKDYLGDRPLSKLTHDVLIQLGLIID